MTEENLDNKIEVSENETEKEEITANSVSGPHRGRNWSWDENFTLLTLMKNEGKNWNQLHKLMSSTVI